MQILAVNYLSRGGELDVVAMEASELVFVEVRSRQTGEYGSAHESVNASKQARVKRAAQGYIGQERPVFETARFDVAGLTGDEFVYIRDAFR